MSISELVAPPDAQHGLVYAGLLVMAQLIVWFWADGPAGWPLPAKPVGLAWWAATAMAPMTHYALGPGDQAGLLPEDTWLLHYAYPLCSVAFWLAAGFVSFLYVGAVCSLLLACQAVPRPGPVALLYGLLSTHNTPLPFLVLLALCLEPWAYKAILDWHVWRHGTASLPQLLQRMPREQVWGSWWLLDLLHPCLCGMLRLVSAEAVPSPMLLDWSI